MTNQKGSGWKKPQAKAKGRSPRSRQSSKSAKADRDMKHARRRVKQRLTNLDARVSILESFLDLPPKLIDAEEE